MDYQPSDAFNVLALLREAARSGDWSATEELAAILLRQPLPGDEAALGAYLDQLKETVIIAKASRADMEASLIRLHAAAGFHCGETAPVR